MTTIKEDIEKIIKGISIENIRTNKKRSLSRSNSTDDYWKDLEDEVEDPSAKNLVGSVKHLVEEELVQYDERIKQLLKLLGYKDQDPDFEGIENPSPHNPGEEKIYWTELAKKLKKTRDGDTTRSLEDLVDLIIKIKKHLEISDNELDRLTVDTDLAMPTKKVGGIDSKLSLKELISVYNKLGLTNPQEILGGGVPSTDKLGGKNFSNMPNDQSLKSLIDNYNTISSLANGRSLNELVDEANSYQALNTEFRDVQNKLETQKDYDKIKTKNEQLEKQITAIKNKLGSDKNATQQEILDKIAKLMNRPTTSCSHTDYDSIKGERDNLKTEVDAKKRKISELESNHNDKNKENTITKKAMVDITNEWGIKLSDDQQQEINSAASNQAAEAAWDKIVKEEVGKLKNENSSSTKLNIGLGILAIGSLLVLGWVLMKQQTNLLKQEPNQKVKKRK